MTAAAAPAAPGLGHNQPPDEIAELHASLADTNRQLTERRDALLDAGQRVPQAVEDDEGAGRVAEFIKQIAACEKVAEASRVALKEPFLAKGRAVDGFFKKIVDPLVALKRTVNARLTAYQQKKAAAERAAREAEERRQREAAAKAAAEAAAAAASITTEADLSQAIAKEDVAKMAGASAEKAAEVAQAKPAELSRTRGDFGSVASLHTYIAFKDLDRAELDLEALRQHLSSDALEKAVRSYIRANSEALRGRVPAHQPLKGVHLYEDARSQVH
jgi:hypothetical protein